MDKSKDQDWTVYHQIKDFKTLLEEESVYNPSIEIEYYFENGTPIIKASAENNDPELFSQYAEKHYRLEGVSEEFFEEIMYDIWINAIEEISEDISAENKNS